MWKEKQDAIIEYISNNQPTIYWAYNDVLSVPDIQKVIQGNIDDVEECIFDINMFYIDELVDALFKNIIMYFNLPKSIEDDKEFRAFFDQQYCVNTNIDDLIENTGNQTVFYDTGITTHGYGEHDSVYKSDLRRIKKKLGITTNKYNKDILQMIYQSSYGGKLVIYFYPRLIDLMNKDNHASIRFTKMCIASINVDNGSGDHTFVIGDVILPFDRKRLFLDKAIHYNYTFQVCGMDSSWCDSTEWEYSDVVKRKGRKSYIQERMEYDEKCDRVYASGGCTAGDMNMLRHRDVYYINDYPCGNKCPHCGTFWID